MVPDYAKLSYGIRAPIKGTSRPSSLPPMLTSRDAADKDLLRDRVYKCFKAAAEATGCKMKLKETMSYADLKNNSLLADRFLEYMKDEEGMDLSGELPTQGSTDFVRSHCQWRISLTFRRSLQGDVSYALPAIHPIYAIPVGPGEGNHTPGFTKCAKGEPAHKETLKVAKGLAWSGWRIFVDEEFAKSVKKEWEDMDKDS